MRFALVLVVLAGCAHAPSSFMPPTPLGDERAVVAEFCSDWEEACRRFKSEVLPDPDVQREIERVRFVQFDAQGLKGMAAYEHFGLTELESHTGPTRLGPGGFALDRVSKVLVFLVIINDRAVRRYVGSPFDRRAFIAFLDSAAQLGGSERELLDALHNGPDDSAHALRAANWYQLHGRDQPAIDAWQHLSSLAITDPELHAEADWHAGVLSRKGARHDASAALGFARDHAGTTWGQRALVVAIASGRFSSSEIEPVLRDSFDHVRDNVEAVRALALDALRAQLYDLALTIAQQGVRLTRSQSPRELDLLGEVYHARHEKRAAVAMIQQAQTLEPGNARLQADLSRFSDNFEAGDKWREWDASALDSTRLFNGEH